MTYLASPYTHKNPEVMAARLLAVQKKVAAMLLEGRHVYSPIVHNAPLVHGFGLPLDWDFWSPLDFAMIEILPGFAVLTLDGWKDSRGVCDEIKKAQYIGRRILFEDPI